MSDRTEGQERLAEQSGADSESVGKIERRLRDVVALSTLPAVWLQADPLRISESLAAALFTTISPAFIFVGLRCGADDEPAETAQTGRNRTSPALARELGPALLDWARDHDPDELMTAPNPAGPGAIRIAARAVGLGAELGVIAAGYAENEQPGEQFHHLLLNIAATQAATAVQNVRLQRSLRQSIAETDESRASERRAREEVEVLQDVSSTLAGELELKNLVQRVTDAATRLSGAKFGAFFYNVLNEEGEAYLLYTLSGAPREAFEKFGLPRNTAIFEPTFRGTGVVRLDDVHDDPRYGKNPPHRGMPEGHLPVRSYLAVPVRSRSGEVLGGLFLGHPERGIFTGRAERLVTGIAAQAAIAVDNARLFGQAQDEIAVRRRHQEQQKVLIDELNHRVKNTLAAVQAIAMQTLKGDAPIGEERRSYQARLAALAAVHDLLTEDSWTGADLGNVVRGSLAPYGIGENGRVAIEGPNVWLKPKAALTLGMALHELATNAAKYGALSNGTGQVRVAWNVEREAELRLRWRESGGPRVETPLRRGFGSLMIERGLAHDLRGDVQLSFEPGGVVCSMTLELSAIGGGET